MLTSKPVTNVQERNLALSTFAINSLIHINQKEKVGLLIIAKMGNLHYRLNFNLGKINEIFYHSLKEHLKITRIGKFGGEIEKPTTFQAKLIQKWQAFACVVHFYTNSQTSRGYIFLILQHFVTKPGNFTNFNMLFRAVVKDFVRLTSIKI